MDLKIKIDKRAKKYHQKGLRNGEVKKAKLIASKDISQECGKGKLFTRNYIFKEYLILKLSEYPDRIIHI